MGSVIVENGKKVLTMDEYIKRESFMKRFCERCNEEMSDSPCEPSDCFAREVIKTFPAADVAQVRHGRWMFGKDLPYSWGQIPKNKYHLYCSECLEQAFNRSEDNDPDFDVDTSYCPNCGAKMDRGDDDG